MCGFPCGCGCSLFEFTLDQDEATPAELEDIGGGWLRFNKSLPGQNWGLFFSFEEGAGTIAAGRVESYNLQLRIVSKTMGNLATAQMKRIRYNEPPGNGNNGSLDITATTSDTANFWIRPTITNLSLPSSFSQSTFRILSQPSSLEFSINSGLNYFSTRSTDNANWPDQIANNISSSLNPQTQPRITSVNGSGIYLPPAVVNHPVKLELKIDWLESHESKIKIFALRTADIETEHRAACGLYRHCRFNGPSYATPRWSIGSITTPAGSHTFESSGIDGTAPQSRTIESFNDEYRMTLNTPNPRYNQRICITDLFESDHARLRESVDILGAGVLHFPAPIQDTNNYQGGGTFSLKGFHVTGSRVSIASETDTERTLQCRLSLRYRSLATASEVSTENEFNFDESSFARILETDRRRYFSNLPSTFNSGQIRLPSPAGLALGSDHYVRSLALPGVNRSMDINFSKTIPKWDGIPPVVNFTGGDILTYEIGSDFFSKDDATGLNGRGFYMTQLQSVASGTVTKNPGFNTYQTTGQMEYTASGSPVVIDNFAVQWDPDPNPNLPHPA